MAYKVLTYVNLPFIEVRKSPGDTVTKQELKDAKQTEEDIKELLKYGSLSDDMDAPIHPQNIIPDPNMPTIQSVVANAQAAVAELKETGQEIPKELQAVADLEITHVTGGDAGASDDRNR